MERDGLAAIVIDDKSDLTMVFMTCCSLGLHVYVGCSKEVSSID